MDQKKVLTFKKNGVFVIELSFAPANCYSYEMMQQLDAAILAARFDSSVQVIVITGAGEKFFCAGADINWLNGAVPDQKYNFCLHANETLMRLEHTPKLVIAAINGHCVGGGFEIALACDLRIARENAGNIGLPEVKLGVLPGTGGTARLTRLLGKSAALEFMIEGKTVSMAEGKNLGLLNQVWPSQNRDEFLQKVITYAQNFCPPHAASMAVAHIKRSVQSGGEMSMADHLCLERELQQRLFASSDAKEGIKAYAEKRAAVFSGC